jgi:hypothetical protein
MLQNKIRSRGLTLSSLTRSQEFERGRCQSGCLARAGSGGRGRFISSHGEMYCEMLRVSE